MLASLRVCVPLAAALLLAGCFGGESPAGGPGNNSTTNGTNGTNTTGPSPRIVWTNHPGDADGPASTSAGELASFTWRVTAASGARITKTQLCWHDASHASAAGTDVVAAYNQSCADGYQTVPGDYPADSDVNRMVVSPSPGTWYARVWAKVGDASVASGEVAWTVTEPSRTTVTVPKPLPPSNGEVAVTWRVNGPAGDVTETGIAWGPASVPDGTATGGDTTPVGGASAYTGGTKTAEPKSAPATFTASIPTGGTVYYRAWAVVGGATYWSHEHTA